MRKIAIKNEVCLTDLSKAFRILVRQRNLGIHHSPAMPLNDLHYNGSGICCNFHVEIGSVRHHERIKTPYRNKSIVRSRGFLPKLKIYLRRNDNVLRG